MHLMSKRNIKNLFIILHKNETLSDFYSKVLNVSFNSKGILKKSQDIRDRKEVKLQL